MASCLIDRNAFWYNIRFLYLPSELVDVILSYCCEPFIDDMVEHFCRVSSNEGLREAKSYYKVYNAQCRLSPKLPVAVKLRSHHAVPWASILTRFGHYLYILDMLPRCFIDLSDVSRGLKVSTQFEYVPGTQPVKGAYGLKFLAYNNTYLVPYRGHNTVTLSVSYDGIQEECLVYLVCIVTTVKLDRTGPFEALDIKLETTHRSDKLCKTPRDIRSFFDELCKPYRDP